MKGYFNDDDVPEYRIVPVRTKGLNPYRGWIDVLFPDKKTENILNTEKLRPSIGEIEESYE